MRSLRTRMLVVALVVAVAAVGITALVASRATSSEVRAAIEEDIAAEEGIYEALSYYAFTRGSWDDVDEVVASLATEYDERIALTTVDGDPIADSAVILDGEEQPLPDAPVGFIDPESPVISFEDPFIPEAGVAEILGGVGSLLDEGVALAEALDAAGVAFRLEDEFGIPVPVWDFEDPLAAAVVESFVVGRLQRYGAEFGIFGPGGDLGSVDAQADQLAAFLNDLGIDHSVRTDPSGFNYVEWDVHDDAANNAVMEFFSLGFDPGVIISGAIGESFRLETAPSALLFLGFEEDDPVFPDPVGWRLLLAVGLVGLLAVIVTYLASRRVLRPIGDLTRAARRMGAGDLSERVAVGGADELAELGGAFNSMAASLEAQDELRRTFTSDIAHELRTPLSNIRGYLEALQEGVAEPTPQLIDSLHEESLYLQDLLDDLQYLSLAEAGALRVSPEPTEVKALLDQVASAHRARADASGVQIEVDGPDHCVAVIDPVRIRQVLGNLVDNAIRHSDEGGRVILALEEVGGTAVIRVADTGSGIEAEHLPHVFDRFYRADASRSRDTGGTGLGLAIARQLVLLHGGTIDVQSVVDQGTTVTVRLPLGGVTG